MTVVRRTARHATAAVAALAVALVLTSCGESADTDSAEDPSTPGASSSEPAPEPTEEATEEATETDDGEEPEPTSPACSEVWVDGKAFPQKYAGCFDDDKQRWVQAMVYRCSSGQQLVTYRRTFYAAKGEQVNETDGPLARDPEFKKVLASCGA
jgi:hypothetical protein